MAGQDANTLVQIGAEPNVLADRRAIEPGLGVMAQNYDGSLEADRGQLIELFGRFLPVGFYYKAFFRHGSLEVLGDDHPQPRRARQSRSRRPSRLFRQAISLRRCGGGRRRAGRPVGGPRRRPRAAPRSSSSRNGRILGGNLCYARIGREGDARLRRGARSSPAQVKAKSNIRVLTDAVCTGWFSDNWLPIVQANRLYKLRAKSVVMATGSLEQPAVFRNNDLPGVMHGHGGPAADPPLWRPARAQGGGAGGQ